MDKSTKNWTFLNAVPEPGAFLPETSLPADLPQPGIYLLWSLDGRLVYIGQSSHIARRLGQHRGVLGSHGSVLATPTPPEKQFHSVTWTPVADLSARLRIESILILAAIPHYNRAVTVGIAPDGTLFDSTRVNYGRRLRSAATRTRAAAKRAAAKSAAGAATGSIPRAKTRLGPRNRGG